MNKSTRINELHRLIESFAITGNLRVVEALKRELKDLQDDAAHLSTADGNNDDTPSGDAGKGEHQDRSSLVPRKSVAALED